MRLNYENRPRNLSVLTKKSGLSDNRNKLWFQISLLATENWLQQQTSCRMCDCHLIFFLYCINENKDDCDNTKYCIAFESVPMKKWSEVVSLLNHSKFDAVNEESSKYFNTLKYSWTSALMLSSWCKIFRLFRVIVEISSAPGLNDFLLGVSHFVAIKTESFRMALEQPPNLMFQSAFKLSLNLTTLFPCSNS